MTFLNSAPFWLIVCFLVIAVYVSADGKRKHRAKVLKQLKSSFGKPSGRRYGEDEYERLTHYYRECVEQSGEGIDDITWNDLNMDDIFKQMNIANSSAGQEYLYRLLRTPAESPDRLREIDSLAEYFAAHEKERIALQQEFVKLGFVKYLSLSDYIGLMVGMEPGGNGVHIAALIALAAAFVVCFAVNPVIGIGLIVAAVTFSILTYYKMKAKVEHYFVCIAQIVRMTAAAQAIAQQKNAGLEEYNKKLEELCKKFQSVTKNAWLLESGNVNGSLSEMAMEYMRMLTHVDLMKFNSMVRHIGNCQAEVYELFDTLGLLEACISVASYRQMLPYWSKPQLLTGSRRKLVIEEGYHPLIEKPVANSMHTEKNVLLTGSNASGKSTFLRTIAVNAVLSQTIFTSVSKNYQAPYFRIYSSMSLKDDLGGKNSYYIVEIKALKRILTAAEQTGCPVLCFVDEVLRGTNTVERIAASSEILKYLKDKNVLCFAATHDIELTAILSGCYDNYHFQEEVTDSDVSFNFKLFKGPATTRNAIKLLKMIGYDASIIKGAECQAGYFIGNGVWKI